MKDEELLSILQSLDQVAFDKIQITGDSIQIHDSQFFILNPHPEFEFTVNKKIITQTAFITSNDDVKWKWAGESPRPFILTFSEDQMTLTLQMMDRIPFEYRPAFEIKEFELFCQATRHYLQENPISLDEILEQINKLGLKTVPDYQKILQELEEPSGQSVIIAEGMRPVDGQDAHLEIFFLEKKIEVLEEINGKVDFRNRLKIPTVQPNELLARYHPKVEGKSGYNLFGVPVPPTHEAEDLEVLCDENVVVNDCLYFSAISGRPAVREFKGKKQLMILRQYIHEGDVSIETGNIYFSGDVVIQGNVLDGMRVEAFGDIYVLDSVYNAELLASGSITINETVINSGIFAGKEALFYSLFHQKLISMNKNFQHLYSLYQQVIKQYPVAATQFTKTLSFLIDTKIPNFYQDINEWITQVSKFKLPIPDGIKKMMPLLYPFQYAHTIHQIDRIEKVESLSQELKSILEYLQYSLKENNEIQFSTASHSRILTSGSIQVTGKGTVSCHLIAHAAVHYETTDSSSRGDKIKAKEAHLGEVGTPYGEETEIEVEDLFSAANLYRAKILTPEWKRLLEYKGGFFWRKK